MKMRRVITILALLCGFVSAFSQTRKEWLIHADEAFKLEDYPSAAYYYQKVLDPGTHGSRDYLFPYDIKAFIAPLDSTPADSTVKPTSADSVVKPIPGDTVAKPLVVDSNMPKNITQRIGYDYVVHRIAECYRLMRDYDNAELWYAKAVKTESKKFPNDRVWYGMMLMTNKKYTEAQAIFESITADSTKKNTYTYKRARTGLLGCYFALDTNSFKKETEISILDTNVNSSDASAVFASGFYEASIELLVTSARKGGKVTDPKDKEEDPYYLCDIYLISRKDQGWKKPEMFEGPINTGMHEGAPVISINKDMLFFTRWNPLDAKDCGIWMSRFMNGKWLEASKLPNVNIDGYKSMHPSLSFEEDKLYFSSNRPGGKGGMDIWYVTIDDAGNPGMAINLGSNVNTTENEVSPFYHSKTTTLYFASDGHLGIGGLDIFKAYASETDTTWTKPVNMKSPVNSSRDDAYFIILNDQKTAYFSSDREKCTGCNPSAYCYKLFEVVKNPPVFSISGKVFDKETGLVIQGSLVTFKDVAQNLQPFLLITNDSGYYESPLPEDFEFFIKAQKNKYFADATSVSTKGFTESQHFIRNFYLVRIPAGEIVIEGIEYDFDKATLRPRSKQILDTLAMFLELNNQVSIEINSHTDIRGSDQYNLVLSDARAKSCMDYLITKGIDPERLKSKGYGETTPFAFKDKDGNETKYDEPYIKALRTENEREAAHQKNRRTSFVVTGETKIQIRYK